MRPTLACAILLLAVSGDITHAAEPPPGRQRQTTYQFSSSGGGLTDLEVSPSGAAYVAGVTGAQGPFISRVGPDGTLSWLIYESGPPFAAGFQGGLAVDSNDNVYRIYTDFTSIFGEIVVVKYSPEGVRLQEVRPASSNPGAFIIANGLTLDHGRGILYATMDFTDTDFENAALVVQFDLNLVEVARDVYRRRALAFSVGVGGLIHAAPTGKVSLPIREQESSMSGHLTTRFLFLRYDPGLVNRVEDMLPPSEHLGTMQSEPSGDMYGVIIPGVPTFPPSFPFYQRVAPTFGPQRPALGGLIGAGPQAETYWRLGSRQVQKADASGIAVWTTSLLTDAGKDEASYARVRTPHLFLAGSFSASGQRHVYLDRYGQATDSLSVALEPAGVAPGTKTEVRVTLKNSQGDPVADKDVTFAAEPVANSGGHDHGGSRPVGTFSGSNISFSSSPHGRTGPDGKLTATYTASEFGGQETIKVHVTDTPSVSTSAVLAVRERDPAGRVFVPLPTSPAIYVKDGGTLFHHGPGCTQAAGCDTPDQNHFGRLEVVQAMVAIATEWQETNPKLEINDISLSHGGAFDICGTWNVADTCTNAPPPNGGHKAHRLGRGVDFQVAPGLSPRTLPFKQREQLRALIERHGKGRKNVRIREYSGIRSHWHVDFIAF